eukprot:CAMPEP_0172449636 /NCGR_PEP_ID=MMETSP1065-20121228/8294_1 /TAXON_ID=265537 /ORGANISM="Amphiprora paludosa, Strain CCMP125" /LENGTH=745 /DNA_ID=CAMNT_0013201347 /DNA_START=243 /DNA_END=2480 /DNA_ORIENTATION=-
MTIERIDCITILSQNQETIRLHLDSTFLKANQDKITNETLFVALKPRWIINDAVGEEHRNEIRILTEEEISSAMDRRLDRRTVLGSEPQRPDQRSKHLQQRRLSVLGGQRVAAVIVHTQDVKNPATSQLVDRVVFEDASDQYKACSNGAMWLLKTRATIHVNIPGNASEYSSISVAAAARRAVCQYLNLPISCNPAEELGLDNILYSVPHGLKNDQPGVMWAYASTGDSRRFSVYTNAYFIPSTVMHEMGHNYMLGHAKEGNDLYGDNTGHMGGGWSTKRCFNGMNMFTLGWYGSETTDATTLNPNSATKYTLKAIVDSGTGGNVNLKIGPYYLIYNMAKGFNVETEEYQNKVLIHEGLDIEFGDSSASAYSSTKLVYQLSDVGDVFSVAYQNDSLVVELCDIDVIGNSGATVSVGLGIGCLTSNSTQSATDPPIQVAPTVSPISTAPTQNGPVEMTSGEWYYINARKGFIKNFIYNAPVSTTGITIDCDMEGGTGEADLLAKWNAPIMLYALDNDCYPYRWGNIESCQLFLSSSEQERVLYLGVHAYRDISNVALRCSLRTEATVPQPTSFPSKVFTKTPTSSPFTALAVPRSPFPSQMPTYSPTIAPSSTTTDPTKFSTYSPSVKASSGSSAGPALECIQLKNGNELLDLAAGQGDTLEFCLLLPPGAKSATCRIHQGQGDADLMLKYGTKPQPGDLDNDCYPYRWGNVEYCFDVQRTDQILYISLFGWAAFQGVNLICFYSE